MTITNRSRVLRILRELKIPYEVVKSLGKKPDRVRFELPGRFQPVSVSWERALEELTKQAVKDALILKRGSLRM